MRNVLICTVGTSLKGNLSRSKNKVFPDYIAQRNIKGLAVELSRLKAEDRLCGAEINSITSILKKGFLDNREHLYLLVSDTSDGEFIGDILKSYYGRHKNPCFFDHVQTRVVKGLTDESPYRFRTEGLRNLVKSIAEIVGQHGSGTILINATGGYKAQISFAGMIGQALEIPVCYLFERFSEVITLPPQPVSLDLTFWLENAGLFFDLARDDVKDNPSKRDERFSSLIKEADVNGEKNIGLSAIGQLFHETFKYRFQQGKEKLLPPDSGLEPSDKIIKYEDGNASKHPGLKVYLERILRAPYTVRIFTHYYNPSLSIKNYFRPSSKGDLSRIEGSFSNGKATTKFDVVTTSKNEIQRNSAIVDLQNLM